MFLCALAAILVASLPAHAERIETKDGRTLEGKFVKLPSLSNKSQMPGVETGPETRLILLCDDGLRRTFVSWYQIIQKPLEGDNGESPERFKLKQSVVDKGSRLTSLGAILATPFDEFGHRKAEVIGDRRIVVYQGITEITPTWTKVQGIRVPDAPAYMWDQRIATTSIPHDVLAKILLKQIDSKNIDQRLKIVRLYLQMERFNEARDELTTVIKDFPEHAQQLSRAQRELRQRYAQRMLAEIERRRDAGQHQLAAHMLENFPSEDVAGETLQKVRQALDLYKGEYERGKRVLEAIKAHLEKVVDSALRERIRPICDEITAELNVNTLDRMAAYEQVLEDEEMPSDEKLSLAVSGWLLGSNQAIRRLPVAASLFATRTKVREYLEEPLALKRKEILSGLEKEEGATVGYVANLVATMLPTRETPEPSTKTPGLYELSVEIAEGEPAVTCFVYLPPEYDPHRLYPTIVTLHGASTPEQQIDWWTGSPQEDGSRIGQAGRFGYIVIAPAWGKEQQSTYGYSLNEHLAVLNSLRDACRRFSIDTDRVFLSGHWMGGDAAWDIGLAHPDLWAGVIPIVSRADKYVRAYWEATKSVPVYAVGGEMDGDTPSFNAPMFDRCLTTAGINLTVVEYLGRGHENFSDEILRLFDWMGRIKRNFARKSLTGYSMRPFDNFFWWVELKDLPTKSMADPVDWPLERGLRPAKTTATINANNGVTVSTGADRVTMWLSPEIVDFNKRLPVSVNGRALKTGPIEPSLAVLLEDVRTRAARLHPYWAKVQSPGGRVNVADQR
ncbi:MAG: peptidase [Planctomycetia bacterium]|nr:peptidase [Planctomycetia bacterium]